VSTGEKPQSYTMCEARRCCLSICSVCVAIVVYILLGAMAFFFLETNFHNKNQHIASRSAVNIRELDTIRNVTVQKLWYDMTHCNSQFRPFHYYVRDILVLGHILYINPKLTSAPAHSLS